jgi:hypothetical protein
VGTGETRLRPNSETWRTGQSARWIGSAEPYKHWTREVGESGAGVGAAHNTDDGADNRTASEGRGRTWSACSAEVSVGECP